MYYKLFFIIIFLFLFSCGKEQNKNIRIEKTIDNQTSEVDKDTTELSPQEIFSTALTDNILDIEDEDLQVYLEEEIYPAISKSNKVTIDKISSSLYLLQYDDKGTLKNILLQKFYNPSKDEFFFEKKEIQSDAIKQFVK